MCPFCGGFGGGFGMIGMLLSFLFFIIIIIGIGFFIWWLVRTQAKPTAPESSALRILNERYAQGEISEDEYEEKKKHLT